MIELFISFITGLAIGSFLNVVIHRIPFGESVIFPGSHCPNCKHPIGAIDNIPLLSYAILRGRCRNCHNHISIIYPIVELLTAVIFTIMIFKNGLVLGTILDLGFASAMIALIFIDARLQILPDNITYPFFLYAILSSALRGSSIDIDFTGLTAATIGIIIIVSAALIFPLLEFLDLTLFNKYLNWDEDDSEVMEYSFNDSTIYISICLSVTWVFCIIKYTNDTEIYDAYSGLVQAAISALIGGGLLWILRAAYFYIRGVEGMGLGDIKLIAIIGAYFGWYQLIYILVIGSVIGTIIGLIIAYKRGAGAKTRIPLGVFLGAASLYFLVM